MDIIFGLGDQQRLEHFYSQAEHGQQGDDTLEVKGYFVNTGRLVTWEKRHPECLNKCTSGGLRIQSSRLIWPVGGHNSRLMNQMD